MRSLFLCIFIFSLVFSAEIHAQKMCKEPPKLVTDGETVTFYAFAFAEGQYTNELRITPVFQITYNVDSARNFNDAITNHIMVEFEHYLQDLRQDLTKTPHGTLRYIRNKGVVRCLNLDFVNLCREEMIKDYLKKNETVFKRANFGNTGWQKEINGRKTIEVTQTKTTALRDEDSEKYKTKQPIQVDIEYTDKEYKTVVLKKDLVKSEEKNTPTINVETVSEKYQFKAFHTNRRPFEKSLIAHPAVHIDRQLVEDSSKKGRLIFLNQQTESQITKHLKHNSWRMFTTYSIDTAEQRKMRTIYKTQNFFVEYYKPTFDLDTSFNDKLRTTYRIDTVYTKKLNQESLFTTDTIISKRKVANYVIRPISSTEFNANYFSNSPLTRTIYHVDTVVISGVRYRNQEIITPLHIAHIRDNSYLKFNNYPYYKRYQAYQDVKKMSMTTAKTTNEENEEFPELALEDVALRSTSDSDDMNLDTKIRRVIQENEFKVNYKPSAYYTGKSSISISSL